MSVLNVPSKRCKRNNDTSPQETIQKDFKTIKESVKQFHANIAIEPLYVCTCCLSRRLYCTNFTSVNNEEWVRHTFLSALRDS